MLKDCAEEQVPSNWQEFLQISEDSETVLNPAVRKWYLQSLRDVVEENLSIAEPAGESDIIVCTLKLERKALQKSVSTALYQQAMRQLICDLQLKTRKRIRSFDDNHNYLNTDQPSKFEEDCFAHFSSPTPFLTPPSDYSPISAKSYQSSCNGNTLSTEPTAVVKNVYHSNSCVSSLDKPLEAISENLQSELVSSPGRIRFDGMDQTVQPPAFIEESFECASEPSYDWMEEQMARVCGEGTGSSGNSDKLMATEMKVWEELTTPQVQPPEEYFDWHLLRIKHESELEEKLRRIEKIGGIEKRARLEKRFMQLFGTDIVYTKKERDELASLTVKHLMPFYKKQRIASRELFKKVAKHISDSLMERPNLPDENDVLLAVQQFFRPGKSIASETDITQ